MDALLPAGTVLQGRYRIDSAVAKGRNGAIYRSQDMSSGATLAVKEMLEVFPDPVQHEKAVQQFKGEFTTLSGLDHAGLPRVYQYFEDGGKHYLVMDFVEAQSIDHVVTTQDGLCSEGQVLSWLRELLDVLEYLHQRQPPVIFRDLRPANIMLTNHGEIKLIDFGIAKMLNPGQAGRTLFRAVGSPEYAPPEQFGMSRSDARTDIYALGASLYFMLTKTPPPQAADRVIRNAPLLRLRDVNPTVSELTEQTIYRMMAIKPADRPPSMTEVRNILSPLLANAHPGGPVAAPPAPAPMPMRPAAAPAGPVAPGGFEVPATRMMGAGAAPAAAPTPAATPQYMPPQHHDSNGPGPGGFAVPPTRMMGGGSAPMPAPQPPAPPPAPGGGAPWVPQTRVMGGGPSAPPSPGAPRSGVFAQPTNMMGGSSPARPAQDDPFAGPPFPTHAAAPQSMPVPTSTMDAEPEKRGVSKGLIVLFVLVLLLGGGFAALKYLGLAAKIPFLRDMPIFKTGLLMLRHVWVGLLS
ncbi:MAG: serine/threonine protein kinase [Candidatus Xenobia bacterium]